MRSVFQGRGVLQGPLGGGKRCSTGYYPPQHPTMSSSLLEQCKKLLIFYWYHNKNIFNFCLKAKKLKYNLVPQWPREVFDWPANFQHFCYTRVGPWNVHGEIWRWNQKCAKLWHLHLRQLLSDSKPSVSTAISLWPWHRYNKRVKGWLQCCTFPPDLTAAAFSLD